MEKDEADFKKFHAEYLRLAETEKGKELGEKIGLLYKEFRALGEEMMNHKDQQEALFATIALNFEKIDDIIDEKIQGQIDRKGRDGLKKVEVSANIETDIGEVGTWLGHYLRTSKKEHKERIFDNINDLREELTLFKNLALTEAEKGWIAEMEKLLNQTFPLIEETLVLNDNRQEEIKKFVRLRAQMDDVLDEEIQLLTHQDLAAAKEDAHQTVGKTYVAIILLGIISLGVGSGAVVIFARGILQPVGRLVEGAEKIGHGALDHRIEIKTKDEIGFLAATFNQMAERLRQVRETQERAYEEVELEVARRTAELAEANEALSRELTRRIEAEQSLAAEKERLAVTLRSIGDGIITTDMGGKIVLINKIAEKLTGWIQEEAIGRPLREVFHIINEKTRLPCENPVEKVLETGGIVGLANHTALIARDGTERMLADSGAPIRDKEGKIIGVVLVFRDITEQKKMEEELLKASKLDSVGLLAGGIAHDFNNILTAILGNISLAKMDKNLDEIFERITQAEKACLRVRDLTQQLLTFSKGGAPVKRVASIAELIRDSAIFALRGSNVRCDFSMPADLWPVEVDEGQISQVINNLVINAQQAMPAGGGIQVRCENIRVERGLALPLEKGEYVKISIEDHGVGIPKEYLQKIFDPYFTTKQKGSGLGLTTSYSIIKNHDGIITVESEVGVGTTFGVYLPVSKKEVFPKEGVEGGFSPVLARSC